MAEPHVKPPPNAVKSTFIPGLIASTLLSAIGTEAADVLPTLSDDENDPVQGRVFGNGFNDAHVGLVRNDEIYVVFSESISSRIDKQMSDIERTACLKTSRPFIWTKYSGPIGCPSTARLAATAHNGEESSCRTISSEHGIKDLNTCRMRGTPSTIAAPAPSPKRTQVVLFSKLS